MQYVIERDIPGAGQLSEAEIRELSLRSLEVVRSLGPQIQWLHSYVSDDRIYCVYLAPDESLIREHARRLGVPASRISAVRRLVDPARYAVS
jgi:hypothetical protein